MTALSTDDIRPLTAALPPRILVHGRPGVGKTTLASRFPNPVLIDCEGGVPSGISIPSFTIREYSDVHAAIKALGNGDHSYQTVVLDSVDALEPMLLADVCAANKWTSIESPGYGRGYVEGDAYWRHVMRGLEWLRTDRSMMVVLLAHSQPELVSDPRAPSYTSYQLRTHKRARGILQDTVDAIGFLATDVHVLTEEIGFNKTRGRGDGGNTRYLHWESRPSHLAKNRYGLPAKMPCPIDFDFSKQLQPFFPRAVTREEVVTSSTADQTVSQSNVKI